MNRHLPFAAALLLLCCAPLHAQLPQTRLYAVFPPGAKAGETTNLTLSSAADAEDIRQLIFSHPGITAQPKTDDLGGILKTPRFIDNVFTVTVGKDVPPGVYEVRIAGAFGISNSRAFVVSDMTEALDPKGNNEAGKASPVAVDSVISGSADARAVDYYKLSLKKGQRVLIECQAERIDSRMNAVITLLSAAGKELEKQRAGSGRDPMIDFTADADGDYTVGVSDLTYAGGDQYFYRLSVRSRPYIDYVFPPAGVAGQKGKFTLLGRNLPGGSATEFKAADGTPLESLAVEIDIPADAAAGGGGAIDGLVSPQEATVDAILYQFNSPQGASNPVRINIARAQVVLEAEPNNETAKAQKVTLPCEVAGRFHPRGDRDVFEFEAKKGDVVFIELFSHRLGLPVDPQMIVQHVKKNEKGEETIKEIAAIDETPGLGDNRFSTASDDPTYRLTAPEDGTYRVVVRDLYHSGPSDSRKVYRLAIQPESKDGSLAGGEVPDFRLVAFPSTVIPDKANRNTYDTGSNVLRRGGSDEVNLMVFRRAGFNGDIQVTAENLPPGITADPLTIPAGVDLATLVVRAAEDAPYWVGELKIIGKAKINDKEIARQARASQVVWGPQQDKARGWARMGATICVAVTDAERVPFTVTLGEAKVYETAKGSKIEVPVKIVRRDGFKGIIKIAAVNVANNATVTGKAADIAADKTEGRIEIEVKANAAAQGYALQFNADSQISYARNPKAVEKAGAMKKQLDEVIKSLTDDAKKADDEFKTADKTAKDAAEALKKAPADQRDALQKKADEAVKARGELETKSKDAADRVKKAGDMVKAMDAQQKKVTEAAKPKNVNLTQPVGTIVVRVTEPVKDEKKK